MLISVVLMAWLVLISGREGTSGGLPNGSHLTILDTDRIQLLKDALGWMTFRKDGRLMEDTELEPLFLEHLIDKYITSKFYRTFVIAFQHGVLPKLTLKENDACDPSYTLEYKDPLNSSVTWHFQKKFTFQSYDTRDSNEAKFCDYRQGLMCHPTRKLCLCPEGSVMQAIRPNSSLKRCLLQENEVCSLIDMAHGNDPTHSALASNLYHMIFNLEKPLSCTEGTQCRSKDNRNFPKCYSKGPWDQDTGRIWDLGDECAIGLYASPGSCATAVPPPSPPWETFFQPSCGNPAIKMGVRPGYTCYNFGPPRSSPQGTESRIGYCSHEEGSFGMVPLQLVSHNLSVETKQTTTVFYQFRPLFIAFVHSRTVPLRGEGLREYYCKYLGFLTVVPQFDDSIQERLGGRCSVEKTEAMEEIWSYFASLEDDPPQGEDFVSGATKAKLEAKLEAAIRLKGDWQRKFCRVYQDRRGSFQESLRCVPDNTTDEHGNDGTCGEPGNLDTSEFSKKVRRLLDTVSAAHSHQNKEGFRYRKDILRRPHRTPGVPCISLESICPKNPLKTYQCPQNTSICDNDHSFNDYPWRTWIRVKPAFDISWDHRTGGMSTSWKLILEKRDNQEFQRLRKASTLWWIGRCDWVYENQLRMIDEVSLKMFPEWMLLGGDQSGRNKGRVCAYGYKCKVDGTCVGTGENTLQDLVALGSIIFVLSLLVLLV